MNKKSILSIVAVFATFAVIASNNEKEALEEKSAWDGLWCSASVDFNSHYVWRGTVMNDNPCWQPGAYLGYTHDDFGGIYAGVWSSFDLTHKVNDVVGSRRYCGIGELDYLIAYTKSFGSIDFEVQHWFYSYPNDNCKPYNDLVLITKYNNDYVAPGMEVWWSYHSDDSNVDPCFWFNFFLTRDFTFFDDKLTLSPKMTLGAGDAAHQRNFVVDWKGTGADGNGMQLTDQTTTLRLTYALTENLSVSVHGNFTWVPSKTLRDERWMYYGAKDRSCLAWGGIGVTLTF